MQKQEIRDSPCTTDSFKYFYMYEPLDGSWSSPLICNIKCYSCSLLVFRSPVDTLFGEPYGIAQKKILQEINYSSYCRFEEERNWYLRGLATPGVNGVEMGIIPLAGGAIVELWWWYKFKKFFWALLVTETVEHTESQRLSVD